eukprot:CAMPEP_0195267730 /NCGR_PEP_ID=MMETSP0706-20130129/12755_1 /TAXON_ID=33640 /ORGANISM="Asterionellopsis glacialis, Strain CCMP134" /LENGTH=187 /DNA_ID=CAMNT_0040322519 /DNA_START=188 /DNA_END=751 /DNA_ORIENTATION=-
MMASTINSSNNNHNGNGVEAFTLVMMGARRRGKGNLKNRINDDAGASKNSKSMNAGKGQEITGVTLPPPGQLKGWEFGEGVRIACANVDDGFYGIQGSCPRCGFDLWKGDLIYDDPGWEDLPRVACPTCSTTFSLKNGKHGPPIKRKGLSAFVGNLAKSATAQDSGKDAQAYLISRDEDERVYCRER